MTTRLILLPRDPADPAPCLRLDARGRVLDRLRVGAAQPLAPEAGMRDVVVVPGDAVRVIWLDLPARNPVQARAAARVLLQDRLADTIGAAHIAIGTGGAPGAPRAVAVVADTRLRDWQAQCARLGITPEAMIPEQLALPADAEGLRVAERDGLWIVRGPQCAFVAEPDLAAQLVADRSFERIDGAAALEQAFADSVVQPDSEQIDLLQHAQARDGGAAPPRRGRRMAVLATFAALSPLVLLGTEAARDAIRAHWLEQRADAVAGFKLGPASAAGVDPSAALHRAYVDRSAPDALALQAAGLFEAIRSLPGTQLDSLEYDIEGGLRAGLIHANDADLDTLRAQLAPKGLVLTPLDSQAIEGGLRTHVLLRITR